MVEGWSLPGTVKKPMGRHLVGQTLDWVGRTVENHGSSAFWLILPPWGECGERHAPCEKACFEQDESAFGYV
jgi:hypothetical protein